MTRLAALWVSSSVCADQSGELMLTTPVTGLTG